MAVSIDTVYQRVLTLANKEQRGYITPQEFNLLANQAQMEIFEQYFFDIKQINPTPGNTQEFSDPLSTLYEKIGEFEIQENNAWMIANMPMTTISAMAIPWNLIYKIGTISINEQGTRAHFSQAELLNVKDFNSAMFSRMTSPTISRPIACISTAGLLVGIGQDIYATHDSATNLENIELNINYITKPPTVQWAYVIVNDKALYNDNISVDFELHESEETELVYKILKLAGINLKAAEVVQVGQTLEQTNKQTTL